MTLDDLVERFYDADLCADSWNCWGTIGWALERLADTTLALARVTAIMACCLVALPSAQRAQITRNTAKKQVNIDTRRCPAETLFVASTL